jgi:hypothetical protein
MPFKNMAQMRACFAQRSRDLQQGVKPKWDCYAWLAETPWYSPRNKSPKRRRSPMHRTSITRLQ